MWPRGVRPAPIVFTERWVAPRPRHSRARFAHSVGPHRPHDGDLLADAAAPGVKVLVQGLVLDMVPADAHAEAQAPAGENVHRSSLLGHEGRLPLGQDDDAGDELEASRAGPKVTEENEDFVEGTLVGVRRTATELVEAFQRTAEHVVEDEQVVVASGLNSLGIVADDRGVRADLRLGKHHAEFHVVFVLHCGSRRAVHPQHRSHYTRAGMTTARLGLLCLPRSVASAVADARIAEEVGFSMVGVADSQSVLRETSATMALCPQAPRRVRIGPSVTNAITRHPAVAASAIATVDEIAPGRAFFGIGSGDSAILNLAERPSTLADMRAYVETVRALHTTGEVTWRGRTVRLTWVKRAIPLYLSAE